VLTRFRAISHHELLLSSAAYLRKCSKHVRCESGKHAGSCLHFRVNNLKSCLKVAEGSLEQLNVCVCVWYLRDTSHMQKSLVFPVMWLNEVRLCLFTCLLGHLRCQWLACFVCQTIRLCQLMSMSRHRHIRGLRLCSICLLLRNLCFVGL